MRVASALRFAAAAAACVFVATADVKAAYLTTWGAPVLVDGPADSALPAEPYTEIEALYFNQDASYYYFAIEVASGVTNANNSWIYGLWFDTDNSAATGTQVGEDSTYVPDAYTNIGIDLIEDQHFLFGTPNAFHEHAYTGPPNPYFGTTNYLSKGGIFQYSEDGNTMLEWKVPISWLGSGPMTVYAAVHTISGDTTPDYTSGYGFQLDNGNGAGAPEPATILMLSMAAGVGYAVHRRSRRKA